MNTLCKKSRLWIVVSVFVCGTAGSALGNEINVVVPNALENIEGDISGVNADLGALDIGFRLQYTYPASEFSEVPDTHRLIAAIAFRPDVSVTAPRTVDWGDSQFTISTTTRDVANVSTIFSENHGVNQTLVYNRPSL